mgnify:FL=1
MMYTEQDDDYSYSYSDAIDRTEETHYKTERVHYVSKPLRRASLNVKGKLDPADLNDEIVGARL